MGKLKRFLSGTIATVMSFTMLSSMPSLAVGAEENVRYPYTMFAGSDVEGAITVNAGNFCVNGNVATNGTIASSGNMNVNGTKTEYADEDMIYILKKIDYAYFSGDNVEEYFQDYSLEETNISIDVPVDVKGEVELTGNINLHTGLKALDDVILNGEVKNTSNSVICSETGDIIIDSMNVNLNGLVYAPYGNVEITAQNLNLNNIIIIADTITINCPSLNANYDSKMAEFVGIESDIDVYLNVFGGYNAENNNIDITWYTNYTDSSYEILSSVDNESYYSEEIVDDVCKYQYPIIEDFEIKYFKVALITNYGEVIESNSIKVVKSENGYIVTLTDTDGDGLSDLLEIEYGTDIKNPDTDGDGLTDYEEVYYTGTDPTKYDSVEEGISDADVDTDGDGLTNREEIELGTDPKKADTDEDNFSDGDEINAYGTDPLNSDTDNDGLKDGDEPKLGLDPLNPETFGYPDAEHVSVQNISSDSDKLSIINTEESPYKLSIEIESTGYVEGNLTAKETDYSKAINNSAMLGIAAELKCAEITCNIGKVMLKFEIGEEHTENVLGLFPDVPELQGIKRLTIFKYFEDTNMLLPIETKYDEETNTIYTEVDELGTYCIMDLEIWLSNLGILDKSNEEPIAPMNKNVLTSDDFVENDIEFNEEDTRMSYSVDLVADVNEEEIIEPKMFSSSNDGLNVNTPIDVVFLLQISGDLLSTFEKQREMIISVTEKLFDTYSDVRVYVIGYKENSASFIQLYYGQPWDPQYPYMTDPNQVKQAISSINYTNTSAYCNRGAAFTLMMNSVEFRDVAGKYVFQIMNGSTTVGAGYFSQIDACANLNINYSEFMPSGYSYTNPSYAKQVADAIASTNGLNLTYGTNTGDTIYNHIVDNLAPPKVEYNVVIPTQWASIVLDNVLSPDNYVDTDKDNLTDWEEVDIDSGLITWDVDGNIVLPTFQDCIDNHSDKKYVKDSLQEFLNMVPSYIHYRFMNLEVLPVHSNPCEMDSDGDGLNDAIDDEPLIYNHVSEYAGLQYPDTLIDDEKISGEIQDLYMQKYEIDTSYAMGKIPDNEYKLITDTYNCLVDSARANYILSGFDNNPNSSYQTSENQQKFNTYFLSDDSSTSKPYINFSKSIKYGEIDGKDRVALIVVQKMMALNDIYAPSSYGSYDDDTYSAIIEAKNVLYFEETDDITYDFVAPLVMNYTSNNSGKIENWFYEFLREMTQYHNSVKEETCKRLSESNPTGIFSMEVTVRGGGLITKKSEGKKVTPGFADIIGDFKSEKKSLVWEVKRSASYLVGRSQIKRYVDASKNYQQTFTTPLESGSKINGFAYTDPISGNYIVVVSNPMGTTQDYGSGVVLYHEFSKYQPAYDFAEEYSLELDKILDEPVPQTIPAGSFATDFNSVFNFSLGSNADPAVVQGIVVIGTVVCVGILIGTGNIQYIPLFVAYA